jgi:hypothetical protein
MLLARDAHSPCSDDGRDTHDADQQNRASAERNRLSGERNRFQSAMQNLKPLASDDSPTPVNTAHNIHTQTAASASKI